MVQPSKLSLSGGTSRQQVVASSSTREPPATTLGGFARAENLPTQERDDSWIEVSSQPSDDTYSSADEILSDGLNLNPTSHGSNIRQRKRKLRRNEILLGRTETSKAYDHSEDFESSSSAAGEEDEGTSSEEEEIEGEEEDTGTMLGVGYRNDERLHHHHHHHHHHHQRVQGRYSTHSVSEFHRTLESHNPSHSFLRTRPNKPIPNKCQLPR
ncbi:hypothetical protein BGX38DRAFT_245882 [Terfezia claveryi]|nr:hypothetical protein BGX38DRAFT_245882 [Terfezia claveryi]